MNQQLIENELRPFYKQLRMMTRYKDKNPIFGLEYYKMPDNTRSTRLDMNM